MTSAITPWWRRGSSRPPRSDRWRASPRALAALLVACLALVFGIAWMVHRLSPVRPAVLIGYWPEGDAPLPWTAADRAALLSLNFAGPGDKDPALDGDDDALDAVRTGDPDRPVVFYVRAPIETDAAGELRLNATQARGAGPRLRTLLEKFRACKNKQKLLILDVAWADLHPDAAADPFPSMTAVLKELDTVPDPDRTVLAACSEDRTGTLHRNAAHSSEVLGRSIFGYYLERGLRGEADGSTGQADGRVSLQELHAYLVKRLRAWSRANRITDAEQAPLLSPPDADFTLLQANRPPDPPAAPVPTYPEWLRTAWKTRDALRDGIDPVDWSAFRSLQDATYAAEWEWRHGVPDPDVRYQHAYQRFQTDREDLKARRVTPPVDGVPLLVPATPLADDRPDPVVQQLLAPAGPAPPTAAPAPAPAAPPAELLARGVKFLLGSPAGPNPDRVRQLDKLLPAVPQSPLALFVRRFAADDSRAPPRPTRQVRELLRLELVIEAEFGKRLVSRGLLVSAEAAAQALHNAEVLFFARGFVVDADVDRAIETADRALAALLIERQGFENGEATLYEALGTLGDTTGTALRSQAVAKIWLETIAEATKALGSHFARAESTESRVSAALSDRVLRDETRRLREPFSTGAVNDLIRRCDNAFDTPRQLADCQAILSSPRSTGEDRERLWSSAYALAGRLQSSTNPPAIDAASGPEPQLQTLRVVGRLRLVPVALLESRAERPPSGPVPVDESRPRPDGPNRTFVGSLFLSSMPLTRGETGLDAAAVRALRLEAVWFRWHADRYRYELQDPTVPRRENDPAGSTFARWAAAVDQAADAAEAAAGGPPANAPTRGPQPVVEFVAPPSALDLHAPSATSASTTLEFRAPGTPVAQVFRDNRWLRVSDAPERVTPVSDGRYHFTLPVAAVGGAPPVPQGLLVRLTTASGRAFHQRVPVELPSPAGFRFRIAPAEKTASGTPLDRVRVRPVPGQSFRLLLEGLTADNRTVVVTMAGPNLAVLKSKPIALAGNQAVAVEFPPAAPAPAPALGTGAAPPAPQGILAPITFTVVEADGRELYREVFHPAVALPADYIAGHGVTFTPTGPTGVPRLTFELRGDRGLAAPAPVAELVFPTDRNPFLAPITLGNLKGPIPADGSPLALFADGLAVGGRNRPEVDADVRIDGVDRAFRYRVSALPTGGEMIGVRDLAPAVRVIAPSAVRSGAVLPVRVEQDNVPTGAKLVLELMRKETELLVPEAAETRFTAREAVVSLSGPPGPGGAFALSAALQDWTIELPTGLALGRRFVRARLIDENGRELAADIQAVLIDDRAPRDVRFLELPPRVGQGIVLSVRATSTAPPAGVKDVRFAVGRPVNGKLPDAAPRFPGKPTAADPSVWEAKVPIPTDMFGPVEIHAEFVSAAGVSGTGVAALEVLTPAELAKPKPASIRGTVVEGMYFRAGLPVVLTDDKGAEKGKATTDDKGQFQFENLPAGKYSVQSAKPDGSRKGATPVEVKAGETADITVSLYL